MDFPITLPTSFYAAVLLPAVAANRTLFAPRSKTVEYARMKVSPRIHISEGGKLVWGSGASA